MDTLDQFLGSRYAHRHDIPGGSKADEAAFIERMKNDPALRAEATQRLAEYEALASTLGGNDLSKRCYLSHIHRQTLRQTLVALGVPINPP